MTPRPGALEEELNKRFTLNMLIQGAAAHAFLTAHHVVRDELNDLDPRFVPLYDTVGAAVYLCQWHSDFIFLSGGWRRVWRKVERGTHPLSRNPLIRKYGLQLSLEARRYAFARCREKGFATLPLARVLHAYWLLPRTLWLERTHQRALERLARKANHLIWGIDMERLVANLTRDVAFGNLQPASTFHGSMLRACAAGYGGVVRNESRSRFDVVARAWVWPVLSHELTKGTAELICLHGLGDLDDQTYRLVIEEADRVDYEVWLLQAGSELWRKLLAANPPGRPIPMTLMQVARMEAPELERLMMLLVERPELARPLLERL